jgi:hypothetical protein
MQVHVGEKLYDWFFNARTWYRTQFRQESERGNAYNRDLIAAIQVVLSASQRSRPGTSLAISRMGARARSATGMHFNCSTPISRSSGVAAGCYLGTGRCAK